MSLHGTQSPAPKKKKGMGGFKSTGGGTSSSTPSSTGSSRPGGGFSYSPPTYSPPTTSRPPSPSPFGGLFGGGGGGGGIWGAEPTGPGFTANWSDSTRLMVAIGAFVLILLAAGALIFGLLQGGGTKTPQQQQASTVTTKFVPPTSNSGGKTDIPITFSDGTTADVLHDSTVDLAGLGVSLIDSGTMGQFARGGRQFQIDHGGSSFVADPTQEKTAKGLSGANGLSVPVLPAPSDTPGNYLDFVFKDWHVGVWEGTDNDQMSSSDDGNWAANMTGTETPSGFLVLTGKDPVKMTPFGAPDGPSLTFGDIFSTGVFLLPGTCLPPAGEGASNNAQGVPVRVTQIANGHYEGDMCFASSKMAAQVYGAQDFVNTVTGSLEIKNIKPGPARSS